MLSIALDIKMVPFVIFLVMAYLLFIKFVRRKWPEISYTKSTYLSNWLHDVHALTNLSTNLNDDFTRVSYFYPVLYLMFDPFQ